MPGPLSRLVEWFVMQTQKVIGPEGKGGVGPATVIAELHLENFRTKDLHNGAHLSARARPASGRSRINATTERSSRSAIYPSFL
jgi:hypothetical protein